MRSNKFTRYLWLVLGIFYAARVIYKYTQTREIDYLNIIAGCLFLFVGIYGLVRKEDKQ